MIMHQLLTTACSCRSPAGRG